MQREVIRIKVKSNKWLVLEMRTPTLTVFKNFGNEEEDHNMDGGSDEDQMQRYKLKTSVLKELCST